MVYRGTEELGGEVRITVWIVTLLVVTTVSFFSGMQIQRDETPPYRTIFSFMEWLNNESTFAAWKYKRRRPANRTPGVWANDVSGTTSSSEKDDSFSSDQYAQLEALGYLGATDRATNASGVTIHDPRAQQGLNLYSSGHAPEAFLLDMSGDVIHEWTITFAEAFPDVEPPLKTRGMHAFRSVHAFPNGDLIAIFEGLGIIRLDRDSNLLWARHNRAHHDMHVTEDGSIWVLTRESLKHDQFHPWKEVYEDSITHMTAGGETIRSFSLIDAVSNSPMSPLLDLAESSGDVFHTNTLLVLDGRFESSSPHFKAGNALVSFRALNFVGVVDLDEEKLVWSLPHFARAQHDPTLVSGGRILLLDNKWRPDENYSRVVEFDPFEQKVTWSYEGDASNDFYTSCCGSARRLSNGNTLVTETDKGRAFEVTPDKEIVWEFLNPGRGGENQELVGRLYFMQRIDAETFADWIPSRTPERLATSSDPE